MGIPLESVLSAASTPASVAGRSLAEWKAASAKVESYFCALGVGNKLLRGRMVTRVIERAIARAEIERDQPAIELAVEEMDCAVSEWLAAVLDDSRDGSDALR